MKANIRKEPMNFRKFATIIKLNQNYHSVKKQSYFFSAVALSGFLSIVGCQQQADSSLPMIDATQYVDPFIGTGFHGHTFPGPTRPHALVQLGPDTHLIGWDASSGYHYDDRSIYGFSHTHLSGTGIGDLGDISLLP